jgi:hypothetical protein
MPLNCLKAPIAVDPSRGISGPSFLCHSSDGWPRRSLPVRARIDGTLMAIRPLPGAFGDKLEPVEVVMVLQMQPFMDAGREMAAFGILHIDVSLSIVLSSEHCMTSIEA